MPQANDISTHSALKASLAWYQLHIQSLLEAGQLQDAEKAQTELDKLRSQQ